VALRANEGYGAKKRGIDHSGEGGGRLVKRVWGLRNSLPIRRKKQKGSAGKDVVSFGKKVPGGLRGDAWKGEMSLCTSRRSGSNVFGGGGGSNRELQDDMTLEKGVLRD